MHDTREDIDLNPEHYQYQPIHHQNNICRSDNLLTSFKVGKLFIYKFKVSFILMFRIGLVWTWCTQYSPSVCKSVTQGSFCSQYISSMTLNKNLSLVKLYEGNPHYNALKVYSLIFLLVSTT